MVYELPKTLSTTRAVHLNEPLELEEMLERLSNSYPISTGLTSENRRLFLRFYGKDFNDEQISKILEHFQIF